MNPSARSAPRPIGGARGRPYVLARLAVLGLVALIPAACTDRSPVGPETSSPGADIRLNTPAADLRRLAAERGITPMPRAPRVRGSLVRLGRMLAFDNSPWDRFLAGSNPAPDARPARGRAEVHECPCSVCHIGPGFSDDTFHNVALAQFGPGGGKRADGPR